MNTFGRIFKIQIFGESHGQSVGIIIDGCPQGISVKEEDFTFDLLRRKSGAKGTTPRKEDDIPQIISGIYNNFTTGAPITILFKNSNKRSYDYNFKHHPRPGHADFVAFKKFNSFNDDRGGGHFSGRLTLGLLAAGVIAKKIISNISITAKLTEAGGNKNIDEAIKQAVLNKNSIGGIIECTASNMPVGLGEPFFDSVESLISHAVFAIPGIKGIEFGSGFNAAKMSGSNHNDKIINAGGKTETNNAGGINGGISNGNNLFFIVAVKPTSSIAVSQETYNFKTDKTENLIVKGRHDVCFALRVPVIIEAVTACVLADLLLLSNLIENEI
jgi:chorismate synthase